MSKWQPIETAPTDGTVILACAVGLRFMVDWVSAGYMGGLGMPDEWHFYGFEIDDCIQPTHWMPLSAPPTPLGSADPPHQAAAADPEPEKH